MDPEGILLHLEVEPFTKNPVIKPSSQFLIYWIVQPSNPSISNLKTRMFCGMMSEPYRSWGRWYQFLFSLVLWYSHSIIKVHWILITPLLFLLPACFSISWCIWEHLLSACSFFPSSYLSVAKSFWREICRTMFSTSVNKAYLPNVPAYPFLVSYL